MQDTLGGGLRPSCLMDTAISATGFVLSLYFEWGASSGTDSFQQSGFSAVLLFSTSFCSLLLQPETCQPETFLCDLLPPLSNLLLRHTVTQTLGFETQKIFLLLLLWHPFPRQGCHLDLLTEWRRGERRAGYKEIQRRTKKYQLKNPKYYPSLCTIKAIINQNTNREPGTKNM